VGDEEGKGGGVSALLPIRVTCDGYAKRAKCATAIDAAIELSFSKTKKLKGEIGLPEGWIEEADHYSDSGSVSYYCPSCGRERQPWRYR
jgi:hypothetical protein